MSDLITDLPETQEPTPTLESLLKNKPSKYSTDVYDYEDTITVAGLAVGFSLAGVLFLHHDMPIPLIPLICFVVTLVLDIYFYRSAENKDGELTKDWLDTLDIPQETKLTYFDEIDDQKTSIFWLIPRFCFFVLLFVLIVAVCTALTKDKK